MIAAVPAGLTPGGAAVRPERRVPERRRSSGAETRSKLLESARLLADTRNVPEFTVEDIATGAEVSRAAFYMYFENKLAICEEVARTTQLAFIAAATSFDRGPTIRDRVESGVEAYISAFRGDRPGMRMMYELAFGETIIRTLVHDMRQHVYSTWESEIEWAVQTEQCPPLDVPVVSRLLVGMLETFCVRTMRTDEYKDTSIYAGRDAVQMISGVWRGALRVAD